MRYAFAAVLGLFLLACTSTDPAPIADDDPRLQQIQLPPGFSIHTYATGVKGARQLEWSPNGTLFIGTRRNGDGSVYAVRDTDGDKVADKVWTLATGLNMPNGVAFRDGDLYVAEVSRILRFDDIEDHLDAPPEPVVVVDDLPTEGHHGWKFIAFGPDDKLYVPVGAPCNICDEGDPYAAILRMNADGSGREVFARGVRNTVGFDWHPRTGNLYFTDNGRDMMGDDIPPDELNRVTDAGQHFGYPYFHAGTIRDPEFGDGKSADAYRAPTQNLGPHVAAIGMEFYTGSRFPREYRNQIFIAEHGSWNRSAKSGYRVTLVKLDENGEAESYTPFATGWLQGQEAWGRPADLEQIPGGDLLLSDDTNGVVYRITYTG